uniref:C2H2-type domain-containing protein n=1 Tax=Davidia involucrata TaxID=16924 RepID=A0A5B7CBP8_DAVIN
MEFKFRAIDQQASTYLPHPSSISYFTEQALRAGYARNDFGRPTEFFRNPSDVREAIQREVEKERIREEIIAAEITRKRLLEAEVRREMLMEREMALRGGAAGGFSFLSAAAASVSTAMLFEPRLSILHQAEGRSLEEKLAWSLEERLGYSARREIGSMETLPFQRNVEPKISEVKPLPEVSKEKVIFLAKPDGNLSGAKRKGVTPPAVGASELPLVVLKKKPKEEWSCALCQVSATSEQGLNEHLQGKKHKAREAGLRAQRTGKNYAIGLFPKKTKPTKLAEITDKTGPEQGEKLEGEALQVSKTVETSLQKKSNTEDMKKNNELPFQINQEADDSKKKKWEAGEKMQKTGEHKKKRFKFWCEMCQIGAYSEKVMNTHKKGKKHVGRLQELNQNGGSAPAAQMSEATKKANDFDVVAKDEEKETLENVDGAADEVEAENHQVAVEVAA